MARVPPTSRSPREKARKLRSLCRGNTAPRHCCALSCRRARRKQHCRCPLFSPSWKSPSARLARSPGPEPRRHDRRNTRQMVRAVKGVKADLDSYDRIHPIKEPYLYSIAIYPLSCMSVSLNRFSQSRVPKARPNSYPGTGGIKQDGTHTLRQHESRSTSMEAKASKHAG